MKTFHCMYINSFHKTEYFQFFSLSLPVHRPPPPSFPNLVLSFVYSVVLSLSASFPGRSGIGVGKGRLATKSLEIKWLHRESRCEMMLIGGEDVSNDVITLGTCFSMFVYICARFHFALIGGNLTAQSTGSHGGIGGGIQVLET